MDTLIGLLVVVAVVWAVIATTSRISARKKAERLEIELAPVRKLADEDVTALGEQLQDLDLELVGRSLTEGERSDYQRGLDAYESAKAAVPAMKSPDDIKNVTEIVEDGRYAIACVQARVAGQDLPGRRPPCFFDPRHGLSARDVEWAPPNGAVRDVPACALDAERVEAGAEPDTRKVMVGSQRQPYYDAGPAYAPYAMGYFGMMPAMFMGMMIAPGLGMMAAGLGEGLAEIGGGVGDAVGGIGEGIGGIGDSIGGMFDGFDF